MTRREAVSQRGLDELRPIGYPSNAPISGGPTGARRREAGRLRVAGLRTCGRRLSEGQLVGLIEASEPGRYVWSRRGEIIRCPWHGWEFDLRTGQSRCEPSRLRTRAYGLALEPCNPAR